ncbi:hypothetical protein caldi_13630 [Caldinitratiruptor microaerophilus]|uniref:Uncharacterized protein n=1 Tax=Caldinitratiruptor microaerophilus TaxID=671077 RepID=A0AA35G8B9_9FIRM|nr:hypothetical protein caldi_13630 [Caldinitratiruptor microaerophilus]
MRTKRVPLALFVATLLLLAPAPAVAVTVGPLGSATWTGLYGTESPDRVPGLVDGSETNGYFACAVSASEYAVGVRFDLGTTYDLDRVYVNVETGLSGSSVSVRLLDASNAVVDSWTWTATNVYDLAGAWAGVRYVEWEAHDAGPSGSCTGSWELQVYGTATGAPPPSTTDWTKKLYDYLTDPPPAPSAPALPSFGGWTSVGSPGTMVPLPNPPQTQHSAVTTVPARQFPVPPAMPAPPPLPPLPEPDTTPFWDVLDPVPSADPLLPSDPAQAPDPPRSADPVIQRDAPAANDPVQAPDPPQAKDPVMPPDYMQPDPVLQRDPVMGKDPVMQIDPIMQPDPSG